MLLYSALNNNGQHPEAPRAGHSVLLWMQHSALDTHNGHLVQVHTAGWRVGPIKYLLPHWLWVSDGRGEEPLPLQPAIQACPVVVSVASVRQAPRDERSKLSIHGITHIPLSTGTHTTKGAILGTTILDVFMSVAPTY